MQVVDGLPFIAAGHGWVPEMQRALTLGLLLNPRADVNLRCALLVSAAQGTEDDSPEREASWQVTLALLEWGLRPSACHATAREQLQAGVQQRTPSQVQRWLAAAGASAS